MGGRTSIPGGETQPPISPVALSHASAAMQLRRSDAKSSVLPSNVALRRAALAMPRASTALSYACQCD